VDYVNKTNLPASLKNHQGMANTKVRIFFSTQLCIQRKKNVWITKGFAAEETR